MRKRRDGSTDIWHNGWKLSYPEGGGKPAFAREKPPAEARKVPESVLWSDTELNYGGWLVVFGAGEPRAVKIKRRPTSTVKHFFRRAFRR